MLRWKWARQREEKNHPNVVYVVFYSVILNSKKIKKIRVVHPPFDPRKDQLRFYQPFYFKFSFCTSSFNCSYVIRKGGFQKRKCTPTKVKGLLINIDFMTHRNLIKFFFPKRGYSVVGTRPMTTTCQRHWPHQTKPFPNSTSPNRDIKLPNRWERRTSPSQRWTG